MDGTTTSTRQDRGRRVVVAEFVTLDGYMVGPDEDISWVAVGFDPQMQEDIAEHTSGECDAFVFGRVTYDMFAEYWPHAVPYDEGDALDPSGGKEDPRIIRALNESPKVVFSTTLGEPRWANTRVVRDGVEDEVRRLKGGRGKAICVQGSASIVQALARADLVDTYRLYQHPVLLGDGKPLFAADHRRQDFAMTDLTRYANGVIATTYERTDGGAR
jgi:dihydrofolate reductase